MVISSVLAPLVMLFARSHRISTAHFELFSDKKSLALSATAKTGSRSLSVTKRKDSGDWPELFTSLTRLVHLSACAAAG